MKESIGGTQLFVIVIALVLIFTAIMAFTINHSNAFAVKDQITQIIENNGGFDLSEEYIEGHDRDTDKVIKEIVEAIDRNSYRQVGKCPEATGNSKVASYQRNGAKTVGNNDAAFCIVKIPSEGKDGAVNAYYYQVVVFYSLDIPVVKELFNFKAVGETKVLYS